MATKRSVGTLGEADLKGKKVFVRADLNVPLDDAQKITDDTRIRASIPTIKYLLDKGAKVILASHLGRPKGVTPKFSLKPLVPRLSELLGLEVVMASDCVGEEVEKLAAALPDGGVLLLENVRFYKEEEKNDPEFAKKLASVADLYVNDAFGTAHRAHASTEGVTKFLRPSVAGFLMQKELDYLVGAVANPKKPFAAIVGGSKVSSKIGVIESLLAKVDILILGGGMIFTFYKAQGLAVGKSLVEEDKLELATSLIETAGATQTSEAHLSRLVSSHRSFSELNASPAEAHERSNRPSKSMAMAPSASVVSFSARPSAALRPRAASVSAGAGGRVRAGAPKGDKWWAPLVGWSGRADYMEAAAPAPVVDEEKTFVGRGLTEEKARQLRARMSEMESFHDAMYHSAIASRLARST